MGAPFHDDEGDTGGWIAAVVCLLLLLLLMAGAVAVAWLPAH